MMSSVFRHRWGIRLALFAFLVAIWFGLEAYRRFVPRYASAPQARPAAPPRSLEETRAVWRQEVERILQTYEKRKQAAEARDALLGLTVTREDQEVHLKLVLAFNALVQQVPEAEKKWQEAKGAFERGVNR